VSGLITLRGMQRISDTYSNYKDYKTLATLREQVYIFNTQCTIMHFTVRYFHSLW